jgi:hypothetical protein
MQIRRLKSAQIRPLKPLQPIFIEDTPPGSTAAGMPLPIFIQPSPDGDLVWYGWRLLETRSPSDEVNIYWFRKKESALTILTAIAHFIRYRRELYPNEVARIVEYLKEHRPTAAQSEDFCTITGQKNFDLWQDCYHRLLQIIPDLQADLISHKAPLKLWLSFSRWEHSDQTKFAQLWHSQRPTLSQVVLITNMLNDLAVLEKSSVSQILSPIVAQRTTEVSSEQARNRCDALIEALRRRRFPNITAHENRLLQLREQLPHHKHLQVNWDPNFEIPGLQLTFTIRKPDDLHLLRELGNDQYSAVLSEMLELL